MRFCPGRWRWPRCLVQPIPPGTDVFHLALRNSGTGPEPAGGRVTAGSPKTLSLKGSVALDAARALPQPPPASTHPVEPEPEGVAWRRSSMSGHACRGLPPIVLNDGSILVFAQDQPASAAVGIYLLIVQPVCRCPALHKFRPSTVLPYLFVRSSDRGCGYVCLPGLCSAERLPWSVKVKVQSRLLKKKPIAGNCFERARLEPCRKRNQISVGSAPEDAGLLLQAQRFVQ